MSVAWYEVVWPGSKNVLLHGVDNLLIVAEEDSRPRARVQPKDVTVFLLVGVKDLHWLAPQDIHVANQWKATVMSLFEEFMGRILLKHPVHLPGP